VNDGFHLGPWLVEPSLNTVSRQGNSIHLEPKVMEVLVCLAHHSGELLPKDQLLNAVWPETFVTDDVLIHSISELRRVFEDDRRDAKIIQTVHRRGYRLLVPVTAANGLETQSLLADGASSELHRLRRRYAITAAAMLVLIAVLVVLSLGWRRWLGSAGPRQIQSLAVIPLVNLSGDPAQEYFSDGMTDALITDLAQIGSVKVISRTSSMQYKQTKKSLPEIARELNVDGIVEGTVQRSGDRVRITAQLIHGATDKHLWANSYERELGDVLGLERDVANDIAQEVHAKVAPATTAQPRPVDPNVLEAYIQGTYYLNGRGRGGGDAERKKARAYFQRAIDLDPGFAPAYVGLAQTHDILSQGEPEDLVIARRAAEKAVELDPSSSAARVQMAQAKWQAWDWAGTEADSRRAIALNPNNAQAHDYLGSVLDVIGRSEEAWKEFLIAQELDPNQDHLADPLYQRGQFDRAIEIRLRIAKRDPEDGYNHYALGLIYAQKGMYREFVAEMSRTAALFELPEFAEGLQHAYDHSGYQGVLRQLAGNLEHLAATKKLYGPGLMAQVYSALGDKDRAFYWLTQYYEHGELALADPTIYFKTDPWFAPLRSDPRFSDFLRRVSLPP
jgi:TolB-like protein/DNA-binding winged helix-turn-helix (wHTH) protein/Tfp pilus assembly protein PilF